MMYFHDRSEAASKLADKLQEYKGQNPLILAIPRGAVPMAKIITEKLGGSYDVVLVRKLRAPFQEELAIGAVDEVGWTYIASHALAVGADADYIESEKRGQMETINKRRALYTPIRPRIDPAGRIVIVIDDGLATGASMIAALHGLRSSKPAKLICAVPVASAEALYKIAEYADEVVCLEVPKNFQAVGQFYADFPQVSDEEVVALLNADQSATKQNVYQTHLMGWQ
jgi:putative phosphoribosyl transferase